MKRTPVSPASAYHRLVLTVLKMDHKGLDPQPSELNLVGRVFVRAGGSWERLFKGSSKDLLTLRKVLAVAVKRKLITPAAKW